MKKFLILARESHLAQHSLPLEKKAALVQESMFFETKIVFITIQKQRISYASTKKAKELDYRLLYIGLQ